MKRILYQTPVAFTVAVALVLSARGETGEPATPDALPDAAPVETVDPMRKNVLTAAEIAELRTEIPGSREGEVIRLTSGFAGNPRIAPADRLRHARDGTVPFRITADYLQVTTVGTRRPRRRRLTGIVHLYVTDAEGTIVVNESRPAASLCPT